ncbi:MAG: secretin and TonB N-terminal domain-containing protein, partial [Candidatus Omnitrophica bacterium]|nr:secretin and TonB N-terminal domain-containing protein [Candidatus Omnitrophota bacterium]
MKKLSLSLEVIFLVVFFSFSLFAEEIVFPNPEQRISMDFKDASLKDILKIFSIQSGLNFIASEAVQDRRITLYLENVPIKDAMDKIFKANNLTYELDPNSGIFIVKDWGPPKIETVTKVFILKYATVSTSSLKEEMGSLITERAGVGATAGGTTATGTATPETSEGTTRGSGKWSAVEETGITSV